MPSIYETQGRLLSRPVKVYWDGWETDTYRLQQNGWDLSVDQDPYRTEMRMVIRNQTHGFIGQTNGIPYHHIHALNDPTLHPDQMPPMGVWQMRHMGRDIRVQGNNLPERYMNFQAVDGKPSLSFEEVKSLEDLVHFAPAPLIRSQALILPEAQVEDLLAGILERQQDAKMQHFRELANKEGQEIIKPKFHAQIISLAA